MAIRNLSEFVEESKQKDLSQDVFELESSHLLEVKLSGRVWAKAGSMVAYRGGVKFTRQGMLEQGLGNLFKKAVSGEGTQMMKMEGNGRVYVADAGKKVTLLRLGGEAIFVNGNDVLAYEDGIQADIKMMRKVSGMMSGGLFNMRLQGNGVVAITSHYEPLTLAVTPDQPVFTDPNATVAWSGNLSPDIVTDISLGTLFGRGSGESVQLKFAGTGWVVVQPYEEVYFQSGGSGGGGLLGALT
ncbi:AIM24 family protein [Lysobacter fragariae]